MAESTLLPNKPKLSFKKWINKPIQSSIIGSLIIVGFGFIFGYIGIKDDITFIRNQVIILKTQNDTLKSYTERYFRHFQNITDDYGVQEEGMEIKVGISKDLKQNTISTFKGNRANLKYGDPIKLTNVINTYKTSINLLVGYEYERNSDNSEADIFISNEAAEYLGFKDYKRIGIITLFLKKIPKEQTN